MVTMVMIAMKPRNISEQIEEPSIMCQGFTVFLRLRFAHTFAYASPPVTNLSSSTPILQQILEGILHD
jgi:hypothetical protein